MAKAAAKLNMRRSRLPGTLSTGSAAAIHEQPWLQGGPVGDLAQRGQAILDHISTRNSLGAGALAAGVAGMTMALPRANSGGIIPDDPLESLVANLVARNASRAKMQPASSAAMAGGLDRVKLSTSQSLPAGPLMVSKSGHDDDYLWETDPNGGWLSSFP